MDSSLVEISVVLGIFFSGQLGTAMWWGSKINTQVTAMQADIKDLTKEVRHLAREASRITVCESELVVVKEQIERLERWRERADARN